MFGTKGPKLQLCVQCWIKMFHHKYSSASVQLSVLGTAAYKLYRPPKTSKTSIYECQVINSRSFSSSRSMSREKDDSVDETGFNIEENPYFVKYREKLQQLKSSSPEDYKEKFDQLTAQLKEEKAQLAKQLEEAAAKGESKKPSTFPPKSLDDIMKLDLVKDKTPEQIEELWKEYHSKKDCVYAVLKDIDYDDLIAKSEVYPAFLYPLSRQDGYEFFLSQIKGKEVYFTPLLMFQQMQGNSPPCLTLAHFTELKEEKGIVLMAGQYDNKVIKRADALSLVRQMTLYYSRTAPERFNLVRMFNYMPEKFRHLDLIDEYKEMQTFWKHDDQ